MLARSPMSALDRLREATTLNLLECVSGHVNNACNAVSASSHYHQLFSCYRQERRCLSYSTARLPKAFLAVSYADGAPPMPNGPGGKQRVQAATQLISDRDSAWSYGRETFIWLTDDDANDGREKPRDGFTILLSRMSPCVVGAHELDCLRPERTKQPVRLNPKVTHVLSRLTPPFAVLSCSGEGWPVVAATDFLGYRQLYWYQGDRWAAISTSSLALARCVGAELDKEALAVRSLLGFHVEDATAFIGIRKLGPGGICALADGHISFGSYSQGIR